MSKIRSCGSLASGNNALLMIKQEPGDKADRIKELQLKKEEGRVSELSGVDLQRSFQSI